MIHHLAARRVQVDFIQASTAELRRSLRLSWWMMLDDPCCALPCTVRCGDVLCRVRDRSGQWKRGWQTVNSLVPGSFRPTPQNAEARTMARSTPKEPGMPTIQRQAVLHGLHRVHYFCTSRQGHIAGIIAMCTGRICKAFPNE
jgi:hypothetical protein